MREEPPTNFYVLKLLIPLTVCLISAILLSGCSTSQYLPAYSSVQTDSLKQINDDDIRKALEADPQITLPASISIYNASREKFPFQDSVKQINGVQRAVEISPALLNPESYYQSQYHSNWKYHNRMPEPIDLKQLRLYAAQAKTDLVLFISASSAFVEDANILSPLYAGLVTIPFVPGQHVRLTTYVEAYIIDVRNGLLYSSYRDKRELVKKFARVYFSDKITLHRQKHIEDMIPDLMEYVESTITNPTLQLQYTDSSH